MKSLSFQSGRPLIIGVLNVTPDSFSDGGLFFTPERAIAHAREMVAEGADIIDVGGESTRPGSTRISVEEELRRVLPVVRVLARELSVPLSIDTMKPEVAEQCLALGVQMLNDVSGLRDEKMREVAARYRVAVVIVHMEGTPETMQIEPSYGDVIEETKTYLKTQAEKAREAGIEEIIIDPGIGFGKTVGHNLAIIKNLAEFKDLGYPVAVGPSRKSYLEPKTQRTKDEYLVDTIAAVTASVLNGADIIRVHDVGLCKRAVTIAQALRPEFLGDICTPGVHTENSV